MNRTFKQLNWTINLFDVIHCRTQIHIKCWSATSSLQHLQIAQTINIFPHTVRLSLTWMLHVIILYWTKGYPHAHTLTIIPQLKNNVQTNYVAHSDGRPNFSSTEVLFLLEFGDRYLDAKGRAANVYKNKADSTFLHKLPDKFTKESRKHC